MRIVCGALIGLAALPVVFTLLRTRKPEFGTPQLALTLRVWSIVLHVLAGVLIIGAAISEIWLSLDTAGPWLFGIYGAAAAIALLGALGFYLAYVAELPPPPPKPLKPKTQTRRRGRGADDDDAAADDDQADALADDPADETVATEETVTSDETSVPDVTPTPVSLDKSDETIGSPELTETSAVEETSTVHGALATDDLEEPADDESAGKLRNRRPNGKSTSRLFGRSRGGIAPIGTDDGPVLRQPPVSPSELGIELPATCGKGGAWAGSTSGCDSSSPSQSPRRPRRWRPHPRSPCPPTCRSRSAQVEPAVARIDTTINYQHAIGAGTGIVLDPAVRC